MRNYPELAVSIPGSRNPPKSTRIRPSTESVRVGFPSTAIIQRIGQAPIAARDLLVNDPCGGYPMTPPPGPPHAPHSPIYGSPEQQQAAALAYTAEYMHVLGAW